MIRLLAVVVRAVPVAIGAIAGVGCAQLGGIDNTNGNARPLDSLVLKRAWIGASVPSAPLDLTGLQASYFVASSTSPAGFDRVDALANVSAGTWTTKLYDPAPVEFTVPAAGVLYDPAPTGFALASVTAAVPHAYTFPNHQVQALVAQLEHPGRTPAPDAATFTVTAPLDTPIVATDTFHTYVVGAWLDRQFAAGELTAGLMAIGPVTYGFTAANIVNGQPKPDRVTTDDAFLVLRYSAAGGLTGVAESAAPVDQSTAATTVTTGTMVTVPQDQTLDVKISPNTFATRYSAVRPAVTGPLAMSWALRAAPGYQLAVNAGPVLHSGGLTVADVGVNLQYGNPFAARGWNTMFVLGTSESRPYAAPGTTAQLSLVAGMNQFIAPSPGFALTLPAGLPIVVTLDGTPLSTDGQPFKQPTRLVRVTFLTDTPSGSTTPSATLYSLQLWDLVPNAMTATVLDRFITYTATSSQASFDLPPELFQLGHSYTIRVQAILGGFPAIGDGDLVTRELPVAQSYLDSAVITVTPTVTP